MRPQRKQRSLLWPTVVILTFGLALCCYQHLEGKRARELHQDDPGYLH